MISFPLKMLLMNVEFRLYWQKFDLRDFLGALQASMSFIESSHAGSYVSFILGLVPGDNSFEPGLGDPSNGTA